MDNDKKFKILTLDGGGTKGLYSLGVLFEIESKLGSALVNHFDAFYGTSTGAIIASMLAKGKSISDIKKMYIEKIPWVMSTPQASKRSLRLREVLKQEFNDETPEVFQKFVGIVSVSLDEKMPKIFKSNVDAAHKTKSSFKPFFGCSIVDALLASCSAVPFFDKARLCSDNSQFELIDGGFCANNPTLFAMIDAFKAFNIKPDNLVIINVGTGEFPRRETLIEKILNLFPGTPARFLADLLEISSNTTAIVTKLLFTDNVKILRLSSASTDPALATNLIENDINKLEKLFLKGRTTFREHETSFEETFK